MKKTFTLLSLLSVSTLVFSQTAKLSPKGVTKNHDVSQVNTTPSLGAVNKIASPQAVVWSDDFSIAANWSATSAQGPDNWVVGTAVPSGLFPLAPINSTTKANGFGLFDSDLLCSYDQIANLTSNTTINCTGHQFVMLEFQQQYRRYYDSTFVFVSGNNGVSYTKYVVNRNIAVNNSTPTNPEIVKIDISAVAGGMAQVKVRFQFWSPSSLNPGRSGCGYSWMVDDVSIYDLPTNDITAKRAYSDFMYKDGGYYTQIPNTQIMPITFRAAVENTGASTQTNVMLNVNINNGSGSVYSQNSSVLPSLAYSAKDTLSVTTPYMMSSQNGTYTATFAVSQTQIETPTEALNSTIVKRFSVTDTIFARDNGVQTDYTSPQLYIGGEGGSEIGNIYEFSAPAQANSVSVFLNSNTTPGTEIIAQIYKISLSGNDIDVISSSASYAINSAADVNKWVTLSTPAALDADSTYIASILTGGNIVTGTVSPSSVFIGADVVTQQPSGTTLMFLADDQQWFILNELPMIRLNIVNTITGVKNLDQNTGVALGQNIPNPFTKESTVNYNLAKDANSAIFTVTDVMGRVISSEKASAEKGVHSIKLGSYAAGLYYYSLNVDGNVTTKKMIVE